MTIVKVHIKVTEVFEFEIEVDGEPDDRRVEAHFHEEGFNTALETPVEKDWSVDEWWVDNEPTQEESLQMAMALFEAINEVSNGSQT